MEHYVMLRHESDGWHTYVDCVEPIGSYLPAKDEIIAKVEAKRYARELGLHEISVVDLCGCEYKLPVD